MFAAKWIYLFILESDLIPFYTESEQICKLIAVVPLGITASKWKMLRIFIKIQYISVQINGFFSLFNTKNK